MRLTGEEVCVRFYIPVPPVVFAAVTILYPFHRGMWSAARACDNQTVEEAGKGLLVPDQSFGWSFLFQQLAVKKEEVLEPTLV